MNQQLSIHFYDGPMLSVKETAYRLHVSSDTIYAWVKAGILPAFQPGGARHAIQIAEADVQDLLRNCSPARRQMKTTLTSEPVSRTKSHGQSHQVLDSRWVSIGNNNALSLQWNMERASPIQDLGSSEISAVAGNAPGTAIPWLDQERTSHYESAIPGSQQDDNDDAPGPQRDESGDPAPDALLLWPSRVLSAALRLGVFSHIAAARLIRIGKGCPAPDYNCWQIYLADNASYAASSALASLRFGYGWYYGTPDGIKCRWRRLYSRTNHQVPTKGRRRPSSNWNPA